MLSLAASRSKKPSAQPSDPNSRLAFGETAAMRSFFFAGVIFANVRFLWPIVFSNSGSRCQALHDHPCRAHCSLRGRGAPSA